jgi:hypothetical protein
MAFTGKATYSAGTTLPELAEDVSDLIGLISPYETPLLDALGDPMREAKSTHHEWLEDALLPNKDAINDSTYTDPSSDTDFVVDNGSRFRIGDQIQVEGSEELMFVTAINSNTLTVVRGYHTRKSGRQSSDKYPWQCRPGRCGQAGSKIYQSQQVRQLYADIYRHGGSEWDGYGGEPAGPGR